MKYISHIQDPLAQLFLYPGSTNEANYIINNSEFPENLYF